jgi:hypothetical protein
MCDQSRNVFPALPQRWQWDRKNIQTVIEIAAKFVALHHVNQISVGRSYKPNVHLVSPSAAQALEFLFFKTRSSLGCSPGGRSPTSSRKSVPLSANSKRPTFCAIAPVKAPLSWPKSSLSSRSNGMAAQFNFMNGRPHRELRL